MMKVLGIGEIVLDKVCALDCFPQEGTKLQAKRIELSIGGPVPCALILLARLGVECTLIASIGDDQFGGKIKKDLRKESILFIPNIVAHTRVNTVLVNAENGSRTIIRGQDGDRDIQNIPEDLVEQADLILLDRHEPLAFAEVIANKRADTKIVTDPSTEVSKKTIPMMQCSEYPILPIESLEEFGKGQGMKRQLQNLYKVMGKTVIVTAGELGSLIYDGGEIKIMPAASVKAVDTLGAGDIYRGAFAYALLRKWSLIKCVHFANQVAGLQCTRLGNASAIPGQQEIEIFRKSVKCKEVKLEEVVACCAQNAQSPKTPFLILKERFQKTFVAMNALNGKKKNP